MSNRQKLTREGRRPNLRVATPQDVERAQNLASVLQTLRTLAVNLNNPR